MTRRVRSEEKRRSPYKATDEQLLWLENNYGRMKIQNIEFEYNSRFPDNPITIWQIYRLNYKHGWKEKNHNIPPRQYKVWSDDMIQFCREHATEYTYKEMADKLNEVFGSNIIEEQISSMYSRYKIRNGKPTAFHKGHVPVNKGKKWSEYLSTEKQEACRKGCFKKGHESSNKNPIGTIVIRTDNGGNKNRKYRWIKVRDNRTDNYEIYARWLYEKTYGVKLDTTDLIIHLDGNTLNDDINNLFLVKNAENGTLNKSYKVSENPEITKASILTIRLNLKIKGH